MNHLAVVPASEPEPMVCPLTARELQIVAMLAAGLTRGQIAGRLGRSENTVKTQLQHAYEKTATYCAAHLVALSLRAGWMT